MISPIHWQIAEFYDGKRLQDSGHVVIPLRIDPFSLDSQDEMDTRHTSKLLGMDEPTRRVLQLFVEMGADSLDLHTLFEAGGNDPTSRERVLDIVTRLVDTGDLESRGGDFYLITDKGRRAVR